MRLAELQVGGVYTFKNGTGRYGDWNVGMLLDLQPWTDIGPAPQPVAELDEWSRARYSRRVRDVPMMELVPTVTLADGTVHEMSFGPHLHVFQSGWARGGVRPEQLTVVAEPQLVSISLIARRVG